MSVRRNNRGKWTVDIVYTHPTGRVQRICKTSPVQTKRGAELYEGELRHSLLDGSRAREEARRNIPTVREEAKVYLEAKRGKKPGTLSTYRYLLDRHILPEVGEHRLDAVGPAQVDRLFSKLQASGMAPKSVNNTMGVLRAILRYAGRKRKIDHAPQFDVLDVRGQEFDRLSEEEYAQFVAAQTTEDALIVTLLCGDAGLRRAEVAGLWWEDISFKTNQLEVKRQLEGGRYLTPKSGKPRIVPLTARLAKALRDYRHLRSKHVLVRKDNTPWTASAFKWWSHKMYEAAALPRFVGQDPAHPKKPLHALRHTFCSILADRGCPITTLKELAGHSDVRTTMRYVHTAPRALQAGIALLNANLTQTEGYGVDPAKDPLAQTVGLE
jgi:integrase